MLTHEEGLLYIARADYISDPEHAMPPDEFERLMASHPDRLAVSRLLVQTPDRLDTPGDDRAPIDEISHMTFPADPKLTPKLNLELKETASGIPLELADPGVNTITFTDRFFSRPSLESFGASGLAAPKLICSIL